MQERALCQTNANTHRAQSGPGRISIACGNISAPGLGDSGRLRRSSSVGGASAFLGAGALRDRVPNKKTGGSKQNVLPRNGRRRHNNYMYSDGFEFECFCGISFDEFLVVPIFRFQLFWNAFVCSACVVNTSFQVGWHWFQNTTLQITLKGWRVACFRGSAISGFVKCSG